MKVDGNYVIVSSGEILSRNPRVDRQSASIFNVTTGQEVFAFPAAIAGGAFVDISGNNAIFAVPSEDEQDGILYVATLRDLGDFDGNGLLDVVDIDTLSEQLRLLTDDVQFDVNADGFTG